MIFDFYTYVLIISSFHTDLLYKYIFLLLIKLPSATCAVSGYSHYTYIFHWELIFNDIQISLWHNLYRSYTVCFVVLLLWWIRRWLKPESTIIYRVIVQAVSINNYYYVGIIFTGCLFFCKSQRYNISPIVQYNIANPSGPV